MTLGYKLYREVRDYAPPDWSTAELAVAWVIADDANDNTRRSWIKQPLLCSYARMKPSSVRAALARMGAGGYEFRVAHGYGSDGRPIFATKSHSVDYLVPDMLKGPSMLAPLAVDNPAKGAGIPAPLTGPAGSKGARKTTEGAGIPAAMSPKGAGIPAPLPSQDLNHNLILPSIAEVLELTGPVESAREAPGQKLISNSDGTPDPADLRHPGRNASPLQIAGWQVAVAAARRAQQSEAS